MMSYEVVLQKLGHLLTHNLGTSMLPLLRQGKDSIMIDRCDDPYHLQEFDVVMYKRPGDRKGRYVLHRILRCRRDGTYWVVGDNMPAGDIVKPEQRALMMFTAMAACCGSVNIVKNLANSWKVGFPGA